MSEQRWYAGGPSVLDAPCAPQAAHSGPQGPDPVSQGRPVFRAPLWAVLVAGVVAVVLGAVLLAGLVLAAVGPKVRCELTGGAYLTVGPVSGCLTR